ncbi:MAG: hypothetical protein U0350_50330 [Caldilineaceae bacterium]
MHRCTRIAAGPTTIRDSLCIRGSAVRDGSGLIYLHARSYNPPGDLWARPVHQPRHPCPCCREWRLQRADVTGTPAQAPRRRQPAPANGLVTSAPVPTATTITPNGRWFVPAEYATL